LTLGANGPHKPGRLTKLRNWLTVPEAARYLALVFGEDVTEADILRFGLDGQLKLAVRFVNFTQAIRHREPTEAETRDLRELSQRIRADFKAARDVGPRPKPPREVGPRPKPPLEETARSPEQQEDEPIVTLRDEVYDLPMIGGERHDVEHEYQRLTGGPEVTLIDLEGPFVDASDGTRFALRDRLPKEIQTADGPVVTDGSWYPPGRLPDDSVLVVRTAALRELETRVVDSTEPSSDSIGRPLKERERATLLTIIAALAESAGIDVSKPSKAAVAIETLTIAKDARVSARTVEDHLKNIPDALERRGKLSS
jgi:hypothetical protein